MRHFTQRFDVSNLDRGIGIRFHPDNGMELTELCYLKSLGRFAIELNGLAWATDPEYILLARIGAQKRFYEAGEPYPRHWKFDPMTGEQINPTGYDRFMSLIDMYFNGQTA